MKEVESHQKVTAKDTAIIAAMAQSVYFADGAYFHDKAMEWREAYEHICDQEAFDMLQDELEKLFNRTYPVDVIGSGHILGRGYYISIIDNENLPISTKSKIISDGIEYDINGVERMAKLLSNVVPSNLVGLFIRKSITAKKVSIKL